MVYHSWTGNTRRLAEAMADELGIEAELVAGVADVEGVRLLFLGSGVYGGRPARAVRRFLSGPVSFSGVKVALFGTYGGDPRHLDWMAECVQQRGGEVIGRFSCKGRDWFTLGLVARGHPNSTDLKAAGAFARQTRDRTINAA